MGNIVTTFGLYNITYNATSTINFATFGRGTKRIDYTIGTIEFQKALIGGGYKPFGEHCQSDHCLIHHKFNNVLLFGNETADSVKGEMRVQNTDKTQGLVYLDTLYKLTQSCNLYK